MMHLQKSLIALTLIALIALAGNARQASSASPAYLRSGHVDVGVAFEDDSWNLHVHVEDTDTEYEPADAVLQLPLEAKTTAPNDPAFTACLGTSGSPIWVLPQVQNPALVFLGLGTEELPSGLFVGDKVTLSLKSKTGPGNFCVYSTGSFGEPTVMFNAGDGITAADSIQLTAGGHSHANWTFTAPGVYEIGLEGAGTLAAGNKATSSGTVVYTFQVYANPGPTVTAPADNAQLTTMGPLLTWTNPAGAKWFQVQVAPINDDGPGIDLQIGDSAQVAAAQYQVLAPNFGAVSPNYVMLPGMTYTWRVRTSPTTAAPIEAEWGPWSMRSLKTPAVSSSTIKLASPAAGSTVSGPRPALTWENTDKSVFYYEVQVSKDSAFGPNAFLYWELVHGGVSNPANTYTIPTAFPLLAGTTYFWRVRPHVQGDGTALGWSAAQSFKTP